MPKRRTLSAKSLVVRLRTAFLVFFVVSICAALLVREELRGIAVRTEEMIAHSAPLLAATHEVAVLLTRETDQAARLKDVSLREDFEQILREHRDVVRRLERGLERFRRLAPADSAEVLAAASGLETATADLISAQTRRQDLLAARGALMSQLEGQVKSMGDTLQGLRLGASLQLQAALEAGRRAEIQQQLFRIDTFAALAARIDDLPQIARGLGATGPAGPEELSPEADLTFAVRSLAQSVTRVSPGTADGEALLAQAITIRSAINDATGLLANARALQDNRRDLSLTFARHAEAVTGINTAMGRALARAQSELEETGARLQSTVEIAMTMIRDAAWLLAMSILAIVAIIIERQLNGRIRSLIRSVREIAAGDFERPVEVSGPDELGEIADAVRDLQSREKELRRSNADLQSFAYAASHDLRSPMKAISDLAEWTLEDARDELSPDNVEKLVLLRGRTRRLTSLLNDLLSYAQVDGDDAAPTEVDIAEEAQAIADLIDPEGHYSLTCHGATGHVLLPVVPLRQILHNLFSNAVKHHDRPTGRISLSTALENGAVRIEVADDGPGIPTEYQDRVFELFQKLESRDEVEGSGVGLALIRKLVTRYGGSISVLSDPDEARGTAFTVTLPARPATDGRLAA